MNNSQRINSICVYCGSKAGHKEIFEKAAREVGDFIGESGRQLVYGAGSIGLMGVVARAALDSGAKVIGVIPEHLDHVEITQAGLTEIHVTTTMHERKMLMFKQSDAFVLLPGGLGSMDEFFETLTWAQLQLHNKPIILLNLDGFYQPLLTMIDHIITEGFANAAHMQLFHVATTVPELITIIENGYNPEIESVSKFA